ncbi:MAG TPA: metal-dependent transcriptional regulator [Anaerolineaceae bacterium]|nr:metal-dependent transcriptional regulator [Anaerolineaceae bacterium]
MKDKISATVEDYLGVMYVLERDGEHMPGVRLAEHLNVTPPTVTATLKRMVRDGLVTMDSHHEPHLTDQGREAARSLMRKHMLVELMLSQLSLSWSKLHKHAHEMEHAVSGEVEAALVRSQGDPALCPHGNPLPGHEDVVSAWMPLTRAPVGERLVIRRIHEFAEDDEDILHFLEENGMENGQEIRIQKVLDFNQTMNVCVKEKVVSLGFAVACYMFVEPTGT